jgi:hypothetical protein
MLGMKGFMRAQVWRPDMHLHRARIDTGWFPNMLLDSGRNQMHDQANWLTNCHVGTDSTPPTTAHTALLGFVANTSTIQGSVLDGQSGSPPYYGWKRITFRFAVGDTAANLNEAGVGWGAAGSTLVSRALILDPITQQPSTITPKDDEILDMTYELRYYAPVAEVHQQIVLNGVTYDTISMAAEATSNRWSAPIGTSIGEYSPSVSSWKAYDGELGTIIQSPSGNDADCDNANQYNEDYVSNSYQIVMGSQTGINGWNLAAGIRSIRIMTTAGNYQTRFGSNPGDNEIPKDTDYTMAMEWVLSWGNLDVIGNWDMETAHDTNTPTSGAWNTNTAETLLRINWTDADAGDRKEELQIENGSLVKIVDSTNVAKWVDYRVTSAYSEGTDWTDYSVTQEDIQNSGPTVGNECILKVIND